MLSIIPLTTSSPLVTVPFRTIRYSGGGSLIVLIDFSMRCYPVDASLRNVELHPISRMS